MKRFSILAIILTGEAALLAASLAMKSAALPLVLLLYGSIGLNIALGLRATGLSWLRSSTVAAIVAALNVAIIRGTVPRQISPPLFLEATTMANLDKSLWKNTGGQYLLLPADLTMKPPSGHPSFLLDSARRAIKDIPQVERVFTDCIGVQRRAALRFGFCDMGFRRTGVVVTF
jgi:hypothetical protein